jgi:cytochrome c biogenesis protein CcmG, thiol:disulfide interchange protein DsbE
MRKQAVIVALLAAALGMVLVLATQLVGDPAPRMEEGVRAPGFVATTLDQTPQRRTFDAYKGQVVLVNVWATWCGPCRVEMPSIQRLHQALGPEGLKVVAVAVDDVGGEQKIRDFVAGMQLTFEVLHEPSGKIEREWQAQGIPSTYIIDRTGTVRRFVRGATEWDDSSTVKFVRTLLAERAP